MRIAMVLLFGAALLAQDKKRDWKNLVAEGLKNVDRLKQLRTVLPRAEFDIAELAKSLNKDPKKAAEFVREKIGHEPYRGFMKGAQGTLISRRGNYADRALLLSQLLAECGAAPTIVMGALAADRQPAIAPLPAPAAPADESAVNTISKIAGVDPARIKSRMTEAAALETRFRQSLWTRVERDLEAVAAALQSGGIEVPEAPAPGSDECWWVRTADGDINKPDGAEERAAFAPADLPKDQFHRVAFRMKIKQNENEISVLDIAFTSAELFGKAVKIGNAPGEGLDKLPEPDTFVDVMAATWIFIPTLFVGDQSFSGHPFDLAGNKLPVMNGALKKLHKVNSVFDELPGGGEKEKKSLTENWLEVELTAPGLDNPVTLRRGIYSKSASDRQRALDLLATRDILVLPGDLSSDWIIDRLLANSIDIKEAMLRDFKDPKALPVLPRMNTSLFRFALARGGAFSQLCKAKFKDRVPFRTSPTLVSYVQKFVDGKPGKSVSGIDILSNAVAVTGPKPASWKESFSLWAGVLDTALEHEVHEAPGKHLNTSVLLERALLAGDALKVEKDDEAAKVLVPGKVASWYRVDLKTGVTLGYVEGGGGQDMAEYSELAVNMLKQVMEWKAMADRINMVLSCIMQALGSADPQGTMGQCLVMGAIGEAFGWASGGILGGAGDAIGSPMAQVAAIGAGEAMGAAFSGAVDFATSGH